MMNRITELEAQVAALHFAVSRLWIKEFEKRQDPLAAAEEHALNLNAVFPADGEPQLAMIREALLGFFEQIVSELRTEKGGSLDS